VAFVAYGDGVFVAQGGTDSVLSGKKRIRKIVANNKNIASVGVQVKRGGTGGDIIIEGSFNRDTSPIVLDFGDCGQDISDVTVDNTANGNVYVAVFLV
jgi:hypothetical protein